MKKLIAIALVLAIGTVANAGVYFASDVTDVTAGQTVTISLMSDEAANGIAFDLVGDNGAGGTFASGSVNAGFTLFPDGGMVTANGLEFISGSINVGGVAPTGVLFSFSYTVSDAAQVGDIINIGAMFPNGWELNEVDLGSSVAVPTDVALNVVPEPMTMALLGLGGLFLRRRQA